MLSIEGNEYVIIIEGTKYIIGRGRKCFLEHNTLNEF